MSSSFSKAASRSRRPPAAVEALLGTTIAGKYRLVRTLGYGGMGTVYKAENVSIGKVVAIKLLHQSLAGDRVAMQRFQREARATVAIAHPHIVEVLDLGQDGSGSPFLVMEYVRGASLKNLLADGSMAVERAARIAGQVLAALAAAHRRGVIHRDLKPENILLTTRSDERDFVKVVDFGISTFADFVAERDDEADLTPTGLTMATPCYASPEQIQGATGRDPRVDLYAVGVMLYEMLAGHRPFDGENLPELCTRILTGDAAPLRAFRTDVPAELEAVVRRAFAKSAGERFQSAHELALALVPFGGPRPRFEEPEPTDTFSMDVRGLRAREAAGPAPRARRRRSVPAREERARSGDANERAAGSSSGEKAEGVHEGAGGRESASVLERENVLERLGAGGQGGTASVPGARSTAHESGQAEDVDATVRETREPAFVGSGPGPRGLAVNQALARGLLAHFQARFGAAKVAEVVAQLEPATKRALSASEGPALARVLGALDRALARGDRTEISASGRAFACQALRDGVLRPSATPELFFSHSAELWQLYFGLGDARVRTLGRGYGRLEIRVTAIPEGAAPARVPVDLTIAMLGILDQGLQSSGGRGPSVRLAEASAFGDPLDAIEATWRG